MTAMDVLRPLTFGQRVAEEESDELASYFVETDHWSRLHADQVDIVYGPKGAGKSALYSLLLARTNEFFDRSILMVAAENPRGDPAFKGLTTDPPASEQEFIALWKLYIASLLVGSFDEYGIDNVHQQRARELLEQEGLLRGKRTLSALLRDLQSYVRRIFNPSSVETTVTVDPNTQQPVGYTGKISFGEPGPEDARQGVESVDTVLRLCDEALRDQEYSVWILLDRLDVAFADFPDLERNALRALFRVYLDLLAFPYIGFKIFLRTDLWQRITQEGFREASHITRSLTISWNRTSLLHLIVRRAVRNDALVGHFGVDPEAVLGSTTSQEEFFYNVFPDQVDVGPNKSTTLDWMLARTRDGKGETAPRELIHLLNSVRDQQVAKLEVGEHAPEDGRLFARSVFKEALKQVSKVRLHQTLYAEYPTLKQHLETLRQGKTDHTAASLAAAWGCSEHEALQRARELVEIGFFEERRPREAEARHFWVPFLYRDGLDLSQGSADG